MQASQEIGEMAFWMWFALLFVTGLVFFIILITRVFYKNILKKEQILNESKFEHQKELLKNSIEIQEKERKRIAENLHDDLISQLYRIKLMNVNASINELIKNGITTTRTISHVLSPPLLEQTSLKELIIDFMMPYQKRYSIGFTVNSDKRISNSITKLNIFRIFQEIITNCNKHAGASTIEIIWRVTETNLSLIVRDNGIGISLKNKKGMGFKNIESRSQIIEGKFKIKKNKPKGTTFIFTTKNEQ